MSFINDGLKLSNGADRGKVNITADEISISDLSYSAVSLTADLNILGVNGRDAGSETANSWWAVHIISNTDKSTIASLLSLSASAPTLPSGYDNFRRVGWVRNNAASHLYRFTNAIDDDWFWWNEDIETADFSVLSAGVSTAYADVGCSAVAPLTCREIYAGVYTDNVPGNTQDTWRLDLRSNDAGNIDFARSIDIQFDNETANRVLASPQSVGVDSSQIFEYRITTSKARVFIDVWRYRDIR